MSTRTSNKQILEAVTETNAAINALVAALTQNVSTPAPADNAPTLTPVANERPEQTIRVPASYKAHMESKVATVAHDKGEDMMLYARHNLAGETKLAYCTLARWSTLKDRGLIGPIQIIKAS